MEKTVLKLKVSTKKPKVQIKLNEEKNTLLLDVKSLPEKNKANKEIIKELKKFFKSEIKIISGLKQKEKIIEIYSNKEEIFNKL
ncbi:MAG: DUF167 domain-containing protein [Candidatus ainarchaeum sp.]|nr:DUF167 domain-containing protein [Candidatus ainarchaeum sp.]